MPPSAASTWQMMAVLLTASLLLPHLVGSGSADSEQKDCCHEVADLRRRLETAEAKLEAVLNTLGLEQGNGTATAEQRRRQCPPPGTPPDPACTRIQSRAWTSSWAAVDAVDQALWEQLDCACQLRVRSSAEEPAAGAGCPGDRPAGWKEAGRTAVRALQDKYRGEKCVLVANGPSLNRIPWDWLPNFKVVMGMNKIYLGLERFNLSRHLNVYAVANPLVMQQSVEQIVAQLPLAAEKFITSNNGSTNLYPCDSARRRIHFASSSFRRHFFTDISEEAPSILCEGYTVTHYSLQVLYFLGCQTVYLVGLDHSFAQTGSPNEVQTLHGDDPNHFDKAYFGGGQQWHTADLATSEYYYSVARQAYESDDRRIVDVTVGGKCTVFDKGDYRDELYASSSAQVMGRQPLRLAEVTTPVMVDGGRTVNLTVAIDADPWLPDDVARAQIAAKLREQAFAHRLRLGPTGLDTVLQAAMERGWRRMRAAVAADDAASVVAKAPAAVREAAHIVLLGPADGTCGSVCWATLFSRALALCGSSPRATLAQREVGTEALGPGYEKMPSRIVLYARSDAAERQQQIPPEMAAQASELAASGCHISSISTDNRTHARSTQNDGSASNSNAAEVSDVVDMFEGWLECTHAVPTRDCPRLHLTWSDLKLEAFLDGLEDAPDVVWVPSMGPRSRPRLREIATAKSAVKPGGLIWIEHSVLTSASALTNTPAPQESVSKSENSFASLIYNAGSKQPGNGPLQNLTDNHASENEHSHVAAGCLYRKASMLTQHLLRLTPAEMKTMRCASASADRGAGASPGCGLVSLCTTQGPPAVALNAKSPLSERMEIQAAATKAMARLTSTGLIAQSTLLTESSEWAAEVERLGGGAIKAVLLPQQGPPTLRTMLETAEAGVPGLMSGNGFAGVMNGDILLDSTRLDWAVLLLQAAIQRGSIGPEVLVIARRTNVDASGAAGSSMISSLNSGATVEFEQVLAAGSLMEDESAMDIFLWTGGRLSTDPLGAVPEFVVGRVEWDKWLLGRATKRGFSIVDATSLLAPVHLTGSDGNFASRRHDDDRSPSQLRNRALYAAAEADGTIDSCVRIACAQFALERSGDGWALHRRQ